MTHKNYNETFEELGRQFDQLAKDADAHFEQMAKGADELFNYAEVNVKEQTQAVKDRLARGRYQFKIKFKPTGQQFLAILKGDFTVHVVVYEVLEPINLGFGIKVPRKKKVWVSTDAKFVPQIRTMSRADVTNWAFETIKAHIEHEKQWKK